MTRIRRHASDPHFWKLTNNMNSNKSRFWGCPNLHATAGAYSNQISKIHTETELRTLQGPESRHVQPRSRKRRLSDLSDDNLYVALMSQIMLPESDPESVREGSDEEARILLHAESDGENPQSHLLNCTEETRAGIPIREYSSTEQDATFNRYSSFWHPIDYRLARFFYSTKVPKVKIDQLFKDGILKGLDPTHQVQFRSSYT